jgi:hypothetical protein
MYGRTVLAQNSVFPTRVSADGSPNYKAGGITVDWDLIAAVTGSDVTLPDGSVIKIGQKYIRYGQVLTRVTSNGKYAPYDPSGTSGQELLVRGRVFICDETVLQYGSGTSLLSAQNDVIGGVFDGGNVWFDRIIQSGVATHTLADGPTKAEFLAAFPMIQITQDE